MLLQKIVILCGWVIRAAPLVLMFKESSCHNEILSHTINTREAVQFKSTFIDCRRYNYFAYCFDTIVS